MHITILLIYCFLLWGSWSTSENFQSSLLSCWGFTHNAANFFFPFWHDMGGRQQQPGPAHPSPILFCYVRFPSKERKLFRVNAHILWRRKWKENCSFFFVDDTTTFSLSRSITLLLLFWWVPRKSINVIFVFYAHLPCMPRSFKQRSATQIKVHLLFNFFIW